MSDLVDLRKTIRDELSAAGIEAHTPMPGRLNPPTAMVQPGDPYVAPGDTYGSLEIRHEVWLFVRPGDNSRQADELDELIETALTVLISHGTTQVSKPFVYEANNASYLATRALVTTTR